MSAPAPDLRFVHRYEPGESGTTLLLLHGTGGDENDLLPVANILDEKANLLSPRGKVLEGGMPRFFRRFAEGVLDVEDLKARTHELVEFVAAAAEQHEFDPAGVIAVGYSNGANIAASTLLLRPDVLSAAILLRPMFPFEPAERPTLENKRVLIASGRHDPIIEPDDATKLASLLRDFGADVTHSWSVGGHALERSDLEAASEWLRG